MTAYKAVVKVFAGEAKKISSTPGYRGGSPSGSHSNSIGIPVPLNADEITGEVFSYTVTGHTVEEVSRKAKAMFDANTKQADPDPVVDEKSLGRTR